MDFLITVEKKPWFCVEAKLSSQESERSLKYFSQKLKIPFVYQVVRKEEIDIFKDNVRTISASKFLTALV